MGWNEEPAADTGSILEVSLDRGRRRFFQSIAVDATMLNSHVIRVFEEVFHADEPLDISLITVGRPLFHAHTFLSVGAKLGLWRKVGYAKPPQSLDVLFRNSHDYGNPSVRISRNWYVWRANEEPRTVGALLPEHHDAGIGVVIAPHSIVHRIRHGRYDFVYPGY